MAFLIKNARSGAGPTASGQGNSFVEQLIHATSASKTLPATTTQQLFRVRGGRVLVKYLIGEVTTVVQTQACNLKVSSKKLDNTSTAVGTAKDISANVDITAMEVGATYFVEGDGTAGVLATAGGTYVGPNTGYFIVPQGEIYVTSSATNTGAMKWDIFYMPLDEGAYVVGVDTATAAI
jgi:hypothetical protein